MDRVLSVIMIHVWGTFCKAAKAHSLLTPQPRSSAHPFFSFMLPQPVGDPDHCLSALCDL